MIRRYLTILIGLSLLGPLLMAQRGRAENADANELYQKGQYQEALKKYREALEKSPESPIIKFNSGDAQFRVDALDEALEAFRGALSAEDPLLRANSHYNLGNTHFRKGNLQEAAESYKAALRLDPGDMDAKRNLELVLRKLQETPQQPSENQNQKDNQEEEDQDDPQQNQEDQQNQNREDPEQQESQQEQQNHEEDSSQQQQEQQNQQEPQREDQETTDDPQNQSPQPESDLSKESPMTREQAERILEALREDQRDLLRQRTIKRRPAAGGKDW